ncbi:phosphopantothenoylcysteine decarboxylase [Kitasatospora albolonga]|uniref:phosphopantothenoylcysteine decarboxylase domain-containing protein n=1 Tax=Kitasatospora albolonga TaxID=68173 RepID=UPI003CD06F8D
MWSRRAAPRDRCDPCATHFSPCFYRSTLLREAGLRAGRTTAAAGGARVTLLSANATLPDPAGVDVVHVSTALELRDAALRRWPTPTPW